MIQYPKPRFREYFETDLVEIFRRRTNDYTTSLYLPDLIKEAVMYSCDMCIEFQDKSDGLLTSDWIKHIVNEVCAVFRKLFPHDFGDEQTQQIDKEVADLMRSPNLVRQKVNSYYNRQ